MGREVKIHFIESEINLINKFYETNGPTYCSNILDKTITQIMRKAVKLGLKYTGITSFDKTTNFINKAKKIHGDKYDYSITEYISMRDKIKIICPVHGIFEQYASSHIIHKQNCPICAKTSLTTDKLIKMFKKKHGDKFDYSLVKYTGNTCSVDIICKKHGIFNQRYDVHAKGYGCSICNESTGENIINEILLNKNIKFIKQKRFINCKHIRPLPFDFYLPEHNICIEFHGKQHYESVLYWDGEKGLELRQKRDKIKMEYCHDNNIPLIIIKYDENILDKIQHLF